MGSVFLFTEYLKPVKQRHCINKKNLIKNHSCQKRLKGLLGLIDM